MVVVVVIVDDVVVVSVYGGQGTRGVATTLLDRI